MKTVANVLNHDITASIRVAHETLTDLLPKLSLAAVGSENRGNVLEACALLAIEIEMIDVGHGVDPLRRIKLRPALLLVRNVLQDHAWNVLAGADAAEASLNAEVVERFELARRDISANCIDLEELYASSE